MPGEDDANAAPPAAHAIAHATAQRFGDLKHDDDHYRKRQPCARAREPGTSPGQTRCSGGNARQRQVSRKLGMQGRGIACDWRAAGHTHQRIEQLGGAGLHCRSAARSHSGAQIVALRVHAQQTPLSLARAAHVRQAVPSDRRGLSAMRRTLVSISSRRSQATPHRRWHALSPLAPHPLLSPAKSSNYAPQPPGGGQGCGA